MYVFKNAYSCGPQLWLAEARSMQLEEELVPPELVATERFVRRLATTLFGCWSTDNGWW